MEGSLTLLCRQIVKERSKTEEQEENLDKGKVIHHQVLVTGDLPFDNLYIEPTHKKRTRTKS